MLTIELVRHPEQATRDLGFFDYVQFTYKVITAARNGGDAEEIAHYTGGGAEDEGGSWVLAADKSEWTDVILGGTTPKVWLCKYLDSNDGHSGNQFLDVTVHPTEDDAWAQACAMVLERLEDESDYPEDPVREICKLASESKYKAAVKEMMEISSMEFTVYETDVENPVQGLPNRATRLLAEISADDEAEPCTACGEPMHLDHIVTKDEHEFCSLECADTPKGDWIVKKRVMVACGANAQGEPDLYFCIIQCRNDEAAEGKHYDLACKVARENAYEGPFVTFDEDDPAGKAMLALFTWESATVYDLDSGDSV